MFTLRTLGSRSHRALSLGRRQFSSLTQASPEKVNAFLQHYPQTEVTHLANGLRVASERRTGGTATIGAWINTGSRYEGNSNNGVAHFLEHMFFKGTSRRSRRSLEQEVENMGGHLNAYTSREQTVFFAKVFKEDIGKAADLLGDILQNSKFEEDRVDRERNTILTEMENVNAVMEEAVFDALHGTAYQGTSLGRTILGEPHNVQTISRDDIQQYFQSHYTADRIVIAAAGDIDHQELVKMCEEHFGGIPDAPVNGIQPYLQPARFTGSDWRWKFDDMAQAHLAIGFPVAGWNDADNYPLLLIAAMLGSYDKSVSLTSAVRGHSKFVSEVAAYDLAESVGVFNTQYR
jgi:processing peptidase subunit beta